VALGLVASIVSIYLVKANEGETDALKPINRGLNIASVLALVGAAIVAFGYVGNPAGSKISNPACACSPPSWPAWCSARRPAASRSTSRRASSSR
jgi:Na+/H+-translocating membrane pyrophosphatase